VLLRIENKASPSVATSNTTAGPNGGSDPMGEESSGEAGMAFEFALNWTESYDCLHQYIPLLSLTCADVDVPVISRQESGGHWAASSVHGGALKSIQGA
jgi:hypothetical protein